MRHIPDEELHAYLDQGLSRTQCVEIESHLAACPSCQSARDSIAALRDRTTALLARLAPPRGVPPAFEVLRRRAAAQVSERRRRVHRAAWAASLAAAVGLGWIASYLSTQRNTAAGSTPSVAQMPAPSRGPAAPLALAPRPEDSQPAAPTPRAARSSPPSRAVRNSAPSPRAVVERRSEPPPAPDRDSARAAALALLDQAPPPRLAPVKSRRAPAALELDRKWRTMSWDGARAEAGEVPHIDGLPVVDVQVLTSDAGKRPLMVVAQQLSSGQVIQTIEGPATDVSQLLSRRGTGSDSLAVAGELRGLVGTGADQAMAMQLGDRMLVITGALPSDSLRAMIRRLNAEMRSK
jgi:Putative zinc-finger